jgi:hypothetical protein
MPISRLLRIAALLAALLPIAAGAAFVAAVVDVPSRSDVSQRILYLKPDHPVANAIVFTGGPGILGIHGDGSIELEALHLISVRVANLLAKQGYAVALFDAPSDRVGGGGLSNFRLTAEHFADMAAVRLYMKQRADAPFWLVGLSFGTISAVSLDGGLPQDQPIGLVLMVPPTELSDQVPGGANLLDLDLSGLRRPTLYLYHPLDACPTAPPENLPQLAARLAAAPVLDVLSFVGGTAPNPFGPCPGGSHHSFNDLETEVGAAIGAWISAHNGLLGGSPSTLALAVEYYHAGLDHYFISSLLPDIAALGSGRLTGWMPTSNAIGVYAQGVPGVNPVCRFYIPPPRGDSHFYSASPAECAETQAKFPFFDFESPNVFYMALPDMSGACPAATVPVYRVWNNRADSNHRYMLSVEIRDQMVARGGVAEGYGPMQVIMCAPA